MKTLEPLKQDIARFKDALSKAKVTDGFMNAVSPGTIAVFQPNEYYPTHEAYLEALAEAMRTEYETIVNSGLILSVDCPDLAMGRHIKFRGVDDDEFLRNAEMQVEAMNHALANLPPDRTRMHVCWGNYEGPHTRDIPGFKVFRWRLKARPERLLVEGANPRHEHEWELWKTKIKLPQDKVLVPGMIGSSTNYVEHPELVAQRIVRYAEILGRDHVMARHRLRIRHVRRVRRGVSRHRMAEAEVAGGWAQRSRRRSCGARRDRRTRNRPRTYDQYGRRN